MSIALNDALAEYEKAVDALEMANQGVIKAKAQHDVAKQRANTAQAKLDSIIDDMRKRAPAGTLWNHVPRIGDFTVGS